MPAPFVFAVLAAGASRRLGQPKALARLGPGADDNGLNRLLAAIGGGMPPGDPETIVVVAGKHAREIREYHERLRLPGRVLENPSWEAGRTVGLQLVQRAFPGHDLCVAPIDVPLVPDSVFRALREEWRHAGSPAQGWLAPSFELRYGHPLILGNVLAQELAALSPDSPLRQLRAHAKPLWAVPVESERILDDLDDPADLERLRALLRRT